MEHDDKTVTMTRAQLEALLELTTPLYVTELKNEWRDDERTKPEIPSAKQTFRAEGF